MDKAFLLGSLFLRLSSIYHGATYGDLIHIKKKNRNHKNQEVEDLLDRAPWKVDLLVKSPEDSKHRKVA